MRTVNLVSAALASLSMGLTVSTANATGFALGAIKSSPSGFNTEIGKTTNGRLEAAGHLQQVGYRYKRYYDDDYYYERRSRRYDRRYRNDVDAPYTRYRGRGQVEVDAPYAYVRRDRGGVRVRAPFVDLYIPSYR
ncbi:MAG: hypothetical protein AAFV45_04310 [Pseudomonadota bacterium]